MSVRLQSMAARAARFPAAFAREAEKLLSDAAEGAARDARARAPVDSGALRDGISARTGGMEAAVVSTAPHAAAVEFGTFRMPPQPHLLPAMEAARAPLRDAARAALERAAGEVWK